MDDVQENKFGLWASFITIALVGIFSGLELAIIQDTVRNQLNIITAIITSIAAASIAFFSGKNLGFAVEEYRKKKGKILKDHQQAYDDWREKAYKSYISNVGGFSRRIVQSGVQPSVQNEQGVQGGVQQVFNEVKEESKSVQAFNFVNTYVQEHGEMPSVSTVRDGAGVAQGTASNSLHDFVAHNADALLEDGVVDHDRVLRANANVDDRMNKE